MKKILVLFIVILILVIIGATAATVSAIEMNHAPEGMPDETIFRVHKGDNAGLIANNLYEQGLIKSSNFFRIYVRLNNTASQMKAGLYRIKGGSTAIEIHNILLQGAEELYKVVIPPGLTSKEIAVIFEDKGITAMEEFLGNVGSMQADGFLFPDTYYFPQEYPADKVVSFMVETFNDKVKTIYPEYEKLTHEELLDKVIMASIVEREYRIADEAPMIASVFYNRIRENMYLGSCATVVYIITEEKGKEHPEKLFYRDLEIESPFNTYMHKGLPPGPICNPGAVALDAAFHPADTDYLYFLLEDPEKGTHFFSRNLAEHNKSYTLYIKGK